MMLSVRLASLLRLWAALSIALGLCVGTGALAASDVRVALVIGNGGYETVPPLANPSRDAATVAKLLRSLGFQTVQVENDLTHDGMLKALRRFDAAVATADWAVIYYAGHGLEVGGVNYLVPVDAALQTDKDVPDEAVSLERVMSTVEAAHKMRVIILDACRNNPFAEHMKRTGASRSVGRGLARVEPDAGMLVAYAAREGQTALDGDGKDSPFVTALTRRLSEPGLEVGKVFRLVRDDVLAETGRRQEPAVYSSLPGEDLYFVPPTGAVAPSAARPNQPAPVASAEPARTVPEPETATPPAPAELLAGRFAALAKSGGLVRDPATAPELYHNARLEEARGDSSAARHDYLALASLGGDAIDPQLRFAALLRAQDGRADAREVYARIGETTGGRAAALVYALQFDGDERRKRLEAFAAANPGTGRRTISWPRSFRKPGSARRRCPTSADRRLRWKSSWTSTSRDSSSPSSSISRCSPTGSDQSRKRHAEPEPYLKEVSSAPTAKLHPLKYRVDGGALLAGTRHGRLVQGGRRRRFRSDRHAGGDRPTHRQADAEPLVRACRGRGASTIQIRYDDASGRQVGPFSIPFDPRAALVKEQRDVLDRFWTSWVAFGSGNPKGGLLYFTQLVSYRCAIAKAEVGFDSGPLSTVLPIPPCDVNAPMEIPHEAKLYMTLPKGTKTVSVQLTYVDSARSDKKVFTVK